MAGSIRYCTGTSESIDIDPNSGLLYGDETTCTITVDDGQDTSTSTASTSPIPPQSSVSALAQNQLILKTNWLPVTSLPTLTIKKALALFISGRLTVLESTNKATPSHTILIRAIFATVLAPPPIDRMGEFVAATRIIEKITSPSSTAFHFILQQPMLTAHSNRCGCIRCGWSPFYYEYAWRVNGNLVQQSSSSSLSSNLLNAQDEMEVCHCR